MGMVKLSDESTPATPAAGLTTFYGDATTLPVLRSVDDAGNDKQIGPIVNASTAGQTPAASTRTYLTGSNIAIPAIKLKVGAIYRCRFGMTKTGAGTALSTIDVCFGTAGTTADTARLSFTKPAGTAVADEAWVDIETQADEAERERNEQQPEPALHGVSEPSKRSLVRGFVSSHAPASRRSNCHGAAGVWPARARASWSQLTRAGGEPGAE